ncbi:MAG: MIR motif-containing protein, partial [Linnemannia gamsii]
LKLTHRPPQFKLHSHTVQYSSGSGQQSVTGLDGKEKKENKGGYNKASPPPLFIFSSWCSSECERGQPIQCDQTIRLRHVQTNYHFHSNFDHRSPLSRSQEVSAFEGADDGYHWIVECHRGNESRPDAAAVTFWRRKASIRLRHKNTGHYLGARKEHVYQQPTLGQIEVAGYPGGNNHKPVSGEYLLWMAQEGVNLAEI